MIGFDVNAAKSMFFDRDKITRKEERATRRALNRFGASIRMRSRRSMRKARQKTLAEMTPEERERYERDKAIARRQGKPRPKRPLAPSKPGEAPRWRKKKLRNLLFYVYDRSARSVVTGPVRLTRGKGEVPALLEGGGTANGHDYEPRPYMEPAFKAELPEADDLYRNSIR